VEAAVERGIAVLALTDHDTLAGVPVARAAARGRVEIVSGVELSCSPEGHPHLEGTVHLIGLLIDDADPRLVAELESQSEDRHRRIEQMVEQLRALDVTISVDDVLHQAGDGNPGRPHVARALVAAGVVETVSDAFTSAWIGDGGRAYVPRRAVTPARAIDLVRGAGGVAVLAHPGVITLPFDELVELVQELVDAGLTGIEVDHPDHPPPARDALRDLAHRLGLVAVGSSDCHGIEPYAMGTETTAPDAWKELQARAGP